MSKSLMHELQPQKEKIEDFDSLTQPEPLPTKTHLEELAGLMPSDIITTFLANKTRGEALFHRWLEDREVGGRLKHEKQVGQFIDKLAQLVNEIWITESQQLSSELASASAALKPLGFRTRPRALPELATLPNILDHLRTRSYPGHVDTYSYYVSNNLQQRKNRMQLLNLLSKVSAESELRMRKRLDHFADQPENNFHTQKPSTLSDDQEKPGKTLLLDDKENEIAKIARKLLLLAHVPFPKLPDHLLEVQVEKLSQKPKLALAIAEKMLEKEKLEDLDDQITLWFIASILTFLLATPATIIFTAPFFVELSRSNPTHELSLNIANLILGLIPFFFTSSLYKLTDTVKKRVQTITEQLTIGNSK